MHELVRRAWTTVGIKTLKAVDRAVHRALPQRRHRDRYWIGIGRRPTRPSGRWLAYQDDGPWAPIGVTARAEAWAKQEPPRITGSGRGGTCGKGPTDQTRPRPRPVHADHQSPPRRALAVASSARTSPMIARNNFRNVKALHPGRTLRDYGLLDPALFFFKRS